MSEYQRYEFMTGDRPLTRAQLEAVNGLSSHIEASSTHALIEYHWGDFKHDPIAVLHEFFDGFLYWANWGAPQLALRFPHGILPADLLTGYDLDDFVAFSQHTDHDILDIHFAELEAPDEWVDYGLGSLIAIRDELMDGDLRALYIVWLAAQSMREGADEDRAGDDDEEEYEIDVPRVPPGLGTLTSAQQALADLLQVPRELLVAAAQHSRAPTESTDDDVATWVKKLPLDHSTEYLVRLAHNEPGLARRLVTELLDLRKDPSNVTPAGERVTYSFLLAESAAIKDQLEREMREQERLARQRHVQDVHDHQHEYWHTVDVAVARGSGPGYDEAVQLLVELREVADQFNETREFQERFQAWVGPHLRRPAFVKRLRDRTFPLPDTRERG
jgi:hypothetical protein